MTIKVGIVEDDGRTRQGLAVLVQGEPRFRLVGACAGTAEAVRVLPRQLPDVVLVDVMLGRRDTGVDCVRRLRPLLPDAQFLMLTVVEDQDYIFESILGGATGYLLKTTPPDQIIQAIVDLQAGGSVMSPSIARKVLLAFQKIGQGQVPAAALSLREREVLEALARGATYKEVADQIGVSVHTIRTHANRIYRKLQAGSRREAVRKAGLFPNLPWGKRPARQE